MDDRLEEPIEFVTTRRGVQVKVDQVSYMLWEATGADASRFVNAKAKAIRVLGPGSVQPGDVGDLAPLLVSLCLKTEDGKAVSASTIGAWPGHIQDRLYQRALDLSGLRDRDETVAGQLATLLASPDCPVAGQALVAWVMSQDPDEYKNVRSLFKPGTTEGQAKN